MSDLAVPCPYCGHHTLFRPEGWIEGGPVACANSMCDSNHPVSMADRIARLTPTPNDTPEHGLSWRDGLDVLDRLLNDCAQVGQDYQNFVRVSAVRDIVNAVRRFEDGTDESIRSALWEDAVANGEEWAGG